MKKEILILHNRASFNQYIKFVKKKFYRIIVIDHLTAIDCYNANIKFIYFKNKSKYQNVSSFLIKAFKDLYQIDLNLKKDLTFKNDYFFSNYAYLHRDYKLLFFNFNLAKKIIKSYPNFKIRYFKNKSEKNFDFFFNSIELFKNKNIKPIKTLGKNNINYEVYKLFPWKDENDLNFIKKYFFKIRNYNYRNKKNILFLNLEKKYQDLIKENQLKLNCNFVNFDVNFTNKKFDLKLNVEKIVPKSLKKNKVFFLLLKNYLNYIWPYLHSEVLSVKRTIQSLHKRYHFKAFITSHPALKSCTIMDFFNQKKVPIFNMLHGGTVGHFKDYVMWPRLHASSIFHKNKIYFQFYSDIQRQIIQKNKTKTKLQNLNNNYFIQSPRISITKKEKRNKKYNKLKIGYILQSNYNFNYTSNLNNNDPYSLFILRTKLLEKLNTIDKSFLNASSYKIEHSEFASRKILALSEMKKNIKIHTLNAKKIINFSDILIFESASTSFIEAILSQNTCPIFLLENPQIDFLPYQKNIVSRSVHIFKDYKQLNSLLDLYISNNLQKKDRHKIKRFFKEFYNSKNKKNNFLKTLKSVL